MRVMRDINAALPTSAAAGASASPPAALHAAAPPPAAPLPGSFACVIFDMDGVLVNVARSYRTAIIRTAGKWGVTITDADIEAAKARGNANNDWVVTHSIIHASGR